MAKITPALMLVVYLTTANAASAQSMTKPLGKWERKLGKGNITLIVEENRLHACFAGETPCTLHADYSTTKDGVIYGVITSIECDDDEEAVKAICDAPFSCRYRLDEGSLIIRDLKCHEVDSKDNVWNGRFKAVAPVPVHTAAISAAPIGYSGYSSSGSYTSVGVSLPSTTAAPAESSTTVILSLPSTSTPTTLNLGDKNCLEDYFKKTLPQPMRPREKQKVSEQYFIAPGFTR